MMRAQRHLRHPLFIGFLAAIFVSLLTLSDATWRADSWYYDFLLSHSGETADDSILIVAIDDKSLSALGRWPWPRRIHADLLNGLQAADVRGVALDILFSENDPADPDGDDALASAVRHHGNVVLPVWAEPSEQNGPPIETMPLPDLIDAASGIGHVGVDVDADGVARRAFLHAGLGDPHWPALALALYRIDEAGRVAPIPGRRNPEAANVSPYVWNRDHEIMIPYVSDAEGFNHVSFVDLMRGEVSPLLLNGRWLLIGVTAYGTGDTVQSPLHINKGRISGVEYQANLLNTLIRGNAIVPLTPNQQLPAAIVLVILPSLLLRRYRVTASRQSWFIVPAVVAFTLISSALLLYYGRYWFPPIATVTTLVLGFALLTVDRVRQSQSLAHSDALTLLANRRLFDLMLKRESNAQQRSGRTLSLLLIDVDHFKHYNDTYGHKAGDDMLRKVARAISRHAKRPRDLPARYGGDELAVLLPETTARDALIIADSIIDEIRRLAIPHAESEVAPIVTVSIGVATEEPVRDRRGPHLIERADAALYRAKQLGRNRSYCAAVHDG